MLNTHFLMASMHSKNIWYIDDNDYMVTGFQTGPPLNNVAILPSHLQVVDTTDCHLYSTLSCC